MARTPHPERHRTYRIGRLRAAVLGVNDGIVSTDSLSVGFAADSPSHEDILVTGIMHLLAGCFVLLYRASRHSPIGDKGRTNSLPPYPRAGITNGMRSAKRVLYRSVSSPAFQRGSVQNWNERLTFACCNGNRCGNELRGKSSAAAEQTTSFIERRLIMKRVTKIAIGAVTALTLGLATAVVSAQPFGYGPGMGMGQGQGYGPGYGPGPGMGRGMGPGSGPGPMMGGGMGYGPMGRGMGPQAWGNPVAAAEWRLSGLKAELKITAAQESAWKTFADQAKQQAEAMQALMTTVQGSTKATAPERLELRNQVMKQREEQMAKGTAAFKELYAALSPEQKALADQRVGFGMMGGRGMAFNRPGR